MPLHTEPPARLLIALICILVACPCLGVDTGPQHSSRFALVGNPPSTGTAPSTSRFTLDARAHEKVLMVARSAPRFALASADAAKSGIDPCAIDDGIFGNGFEP